MESKFSKAPSYVLTFRLINTRLVQHALYKQILSISKPHYMYTSYPISQFFFTFSMMKITIASDSQNRVGPQT